MKRIYFHGKWDHSRTLGWPKKPARICLSSSRIATCPSWSLATLIFNWSTSADCDTQSPMYLTASAKGSERFALFFGESSESVVCGGSGDVLDSTPRWAAAGLTWVGNDAEFCCGAWIVDPIIPTAECSRSFFCIPFARITWLRWSLSTISRSELWCNNKVSANEPVVATHFWKARFNDLWDLLLPCLLFTAGVTLPSHARTESGL